MNLNELSQKLEDHLTDQDIQDAQELLDDTYQEIVDMRGELVEAQAELSALRTAAIADAAEIEQLRAEIDRLNKACDQRAAHEYKLMGDVGMLVAINSELLAGLESMLDEHQALTSSAFKLHGDIRALIAKARGDL